MKKRILALSIILVAIFLVCLILFLFLRAKSYEVVYEVDGIEIEEIYDKEMGFYRFSLQVGDDRFDVAVKSKYIRGKKLIDGVDTLEEDDIECVLPVSSQIETYPVCKDEKGYFDYAMLEEPDDEFYKREEPNKTNIDYEGIELKSGLDKSYYIWNYKGYYKIGKEDKKEIKLLDKESYYNNLAYSNGSYLLTPNYDENYAFTEFKVIDMKTGKDTVWKIDAEISYNSYYLGTKDGIVYMVDRKNKVEYSLDPKRKKIERVDKSGVGQVWNGKWSEVSMTRLANEDYAFEDNEMIEYTLENGVLSLRVRDSKSTMKISDKKVDKIVLVRDGEVFYLVKDELYNYSAFYGENLTIKYSELNFNNVNSIFIY